MITTVMLVNWHHGWSEITYPTAILSFGRREARLDLGAQQSKQEVVRLANAELGGIFAKFREQITVEHRPKNLLETPYIGYIPTSIIYAENFSGDPTAFPVTSISVAEDENGQITFLPTLGDKIMDTFVIT